MTPIPPTPAGVKTAWADPEHMRLFESLIGPRHAGDAGEIVDPATGEIRAVRRMQRLRSPDPADPWATPLTEGDGGDAA